MSLAFKSQLHLHTVHAMLMSQANVRGLAQFQVKDAFTPEMVAYIWLFEPRYVEQAIAWHHSQWDLQEMMKCAPLVTTTIRLPPMCRERPVSPVIEHAWWKEHGSDPSMSFKYRFLENLSFPPCLSRNNPSLLPPHAHDRIRPMDIVSFDRTWLFDRLALIPISDIPPDLRHLEMIMRSHLEPPPRSQVKDFSVYMWPTNGPYDELIQQIAKWVIEDGGSRVSVGRSSTQRADETFGYRKDHWPQTKKNQTDGETDSRSIDNSDEHMHTSPRSPQFGALSLLKSTMPQNDSTSHPHSSRPIPLGPMAIEEDTNGKVTVGLTRPSRPHILFEPTTDSDTDDRNDELTIGLDSTYHPPVNHCIPFDPMTDTDDGIVGCLPNTAGLSHESQQDEPPFSIVHVHYGNQPPATIASGGGKVVSTARARGKEPFEGFRSNVGFPDVSCDGDYEDPDFWPGNPSIKSSRPFLIGTISEAITTQANLLRDKFLEDLSTLADKSQYPRLGLLKATQLNLSDPAGIEKEKCQREKNAFNGWSRAYSKEHPNPLPGEDGHRKQGDYIKEIVTPAWYAFKHEHDLAGDLDEQLSNLRAEMDGMLKRAQCIGEVGVHTIILMVTGRAHDDKSTAWNGVFYGTDASWRFWSSINNPISQLLWQFYIFVNNDTLQLEKPELDPNVVQVKVWSAELTDILKAKASSGKHLRRLLEPFVTLEERFPWQGFADLLYSHQLEVMNWGVAPGFVDLDHNASNSVGGWRLLCSEFHKKPADITIAVRQWSAVDANMSLKDKGVISIMSDHDGHVLMHVSSSQRYLEDLEDLQNPSVATMRKTKRPIPGKPENKSKRKHAKVAATTVFTPSIESSVTTVADAAVNPPIPTDINTVAVPHVSALINASGGKNVPLARAFNNMPPVPVFNDVPPGPAFKNVPPRPAFDNVPPRPAFDNVPPGPAFIDTFDFSLFPPATHYNFPGASQAAQHPSLSAQLGYGEQNSAYQGTQFGNPSRSASYEGPPLDPNTYFGMGNFSRQAPTGFLCRSCISHLVHPFLMPSSHFLHRYISRTVVTFLAPSSHFSHHPCVSCIIIAFLASSSRFLDRRHISCIVLAFLASSLRFLHCPRISRIVLAFLALSSRFSHCPRVSHIVLAFLALSSRFSHCPCVS
ncbi:hypothetical protein BS47DRAFT_1398919 [Hydnum rufescens UP504]|uniref:Uncharacterized protein n=1 Tax=Hydnum rufescens UP504 TaxID=1448309 RepID=A0A9P6DQ68_9AGAM|nr:hypothetical protein BS47DRAFT_1398919 [Hydnum rufescens UP504]